MAGSRTRQPMKALQAIQRVIRQGAEPHPSFVVYPFYAAAKCVAMVSDVSGYGNACFFIRPHKKRAFFAKKREGKRLWTREDERRQGTAGSRQQTQRTTNPSSCA